MLPIVGSEISIHKEKCGKVWCTFPKWEWVIVYAELFLATWCRAVENAALVDVACFRSEGKRGPLLKNPSFLSRIDASLELSRT